MAVAFHSESRRRKMRCRWPHDGEHFASAISREGSNRGKSRYIVRSAILCTPRAEIESRTISDFYIGVLSVLAIVLSVVIGMAATGWAWQESRGARPRPGERRSRQRRRLY